MTQDKGKSIKLPGRSRSAESSFCLAPKIVTFPDPDNGKSIKFRIAASDCVEDFATLHPLTCSVTVLQCYSVTLLHCYTVTMLHCYNVTMLQCYSVTVLQCYTDWLAVAHESLSQSHLKRIGLENFTGFCQLNTFVHNLNIELEKQSGFIC